MSFAMKRTGSYLVVALLAVPWLVAAVVLFELLMGGGIFGALAVVSIWVGGGLVLWYLGDLLRSVLARHPNQKQETNQGDH
jgi:hypothetical protein